MVLKNPDPTYDASIYMHRDIAKAESEFRILYVNNYNRLCNVAFRILREKESAREVVQDVFVNLWNKNSWQQLESPEAYLYTSVYNQCIKAISRRKPFVSETVLNVQAAESDPQMELQELERIIAEGIDSLPEKCKHIFILSREKEMTYAEIAKDLDLSVKTVENQMGIALKKLRDHLSKWWK